MSQLINIFLLLTALYLFTATEKNMVRNTSWSRRLPMHVDKQYVTESASSSAPSLPNIVITRDIWEGKQPAPFVFAPHPCLHWSSFRANFCWFLRYVFTLLLLIMCSQFWFSRNFYFVFLRFCFCFVSHQSLFKFTV